MGVKLDERGVPATLPTLGVGWADAFLRGLAQDRYGGLQPQGAILAGPAKYAIQRASPRLARYLEKSPVQFYSRFSDELPPASTGMTTTGVTQVLGPREAKELTGFNEFLAGIRPKGGWPTVSSYRSGALERGTGKNPYTTLKRPLESGDVELRLGRQQYDPNVYDVAKRPTQKSSAMQASQRETAVHEGMHGAWVGKAPQAQRQRLGDLSERWRRGEPLTEVEQKELRELMRSAFPSIPQPAPERLFNWLRQSGYDLFKLRPFGPETLEHGVLGAAAQNVARRPARLRK